MAVDYVGIRTDEIMRQIVATGYFGRARASDIRWLCGQASSYSGGYLLIPGGETPHPLGVHWVSGRGAYLDGDHVQVAADHDTLREAAIALWDAITDDESEWD